MATANLRSKITMDDSEAQRKLKGFGESAKMAGEMAKTQFMAAGKALAGMFAGVGVVRGFTGMINDLREIDKLARQLGISAEDLQRVRFISEQNHSDAESYMQALIQMNRKLADPINNAGPVAAAEALGINVEKFIKLDPVSQIAELADAFRSASDQKWALAKMFVLLEEEAKKMAVAFTKSGTEIKELANSIDVVSDAAVRRANDINDAWGRTMRNIKTELMQVVIGWERIFHLTKHLTIGSEMDSDMKEALGLSIKIKAPVDPNAPLKDGLDVLEDQKNVIEEIITLEKERTKISADDLDIQERATKQALDRFKKQGGLDGFAMLQTNGVLGEAGGMMRSRTFAPQQGVPTMPGAASGVDRQFNELVIREFRLMTEETKSTNTILKEAVGD